MSHNAEKIYFLNISPQIAQEIKIILYYYSVGPKEEFEASKKMEVKNLVTLSL